MSSQNPKQNQHTQLCLLTPTHTHKNLAAYNVLSRCLHSLSFSFWSSLYPYVCLIALSFNYVVLSVHGVYFCFALRYCCCCVAAFALTLSRPCSLSCSFTLLRSNSRFVFAVAGSVVVLVAAVFVSCTFNVVVAADVGLPTVLKK